MNRLSTHARCIQLALLDSLRDKNDRLHNEICVLDIEYLLSRAPEVVEATVGLHKEINAILNALHFVMESAPDHDTPAPVVPHTVASRTERFEAFLKCHDADTFAFIDWLVKRCREGNQEGRYFLENFVIGFYEAASYFMSENYLRTDKDFSENALKFLSEIRGHLKGRYHEGAE